MTAWRLGLFVVLGATVCSVSACVQPPPPSTSSPTAPPATTPPTAVQSVDVRLLQEARGFVYRARSVACLSTGTAFAYQGSIVTNRHVASGSTSLQLADWAGDDFVAPVSAIASGPDLALLSGSREATNVQLAASDPPAGTPVWATGYPEGDQLSALTGIISDYIDGAPYGEPGQIMEITDPIKPGSSGSPLLDSAGHVVGVVFALNNLDGAGLAIPASTLEAFVTAPGSTTVGNCIG